MVSCLVGIIHYNFLSFDFSLSMYNQSASFRLTLFTMALYSHFIISCPLLSNVYTIYWASHASELEVFHVKLFPVRHLMLASLCQLSVTVVESYFWWYGQFLAEMYTSRQVRVFHLVLSGYSYLMWIWPHPNTKSDCQTHL